MHLFCGLHKMHTSVMFGCALESRGSKFDSPLHKFQHILSLNIPNTHRIEADLGKFGLAIYKKITSDARQQRFQGFKPGTIPPHLLPTYKAYTMDEVAREATLEAMQQNDIRPFESCRADIVIGEVSIPPRKSKKKKKRAVVVASEGEEEKEPEWLVFDSMKDALKAGWEVSSM
jgi:hypothetical protein